MIFRMRPMSGYTTALVICCIISIISFNTMRMRAVKSLVSFVLNQGLLVKKLHSIHMTSKQGLSGLNK